MAVSRINDSLRFRSHIVKYHDQAIQTDACSYKGLHELLHIVSAISSCFIHKYRRLVPF